MYADRAPLEIAAQLLIATLFLGTGIINATTKVRQHRERLEAAGVPAAGVVLWLGFAMQFAGGTMVLLDWRREVGAAVLIAFTVLATALFHRSWLVADPLRRHFHVSFIFSNLGIIGGLLLLMR